MGSGSSSHVKPLNTTQDLSPGEDSSRPVSPISKPRNDRAVETGSNVDARKTAEVIDLQRTSCKNLRPPSSESHTKACDGDACDSTEGLSTLSKRLAEVEKERDSLRNKITECEKQVGDLESHNLDLVEQLQMLEEQLDQAHARNVFNAPTECVDTVAAKDRYIEKLERETKVVLEEITRLKSRYKKKIRLMNSQISEAKHESSLTAFEMKDEVRRLREENSALLEQLKQHEQARGEDGSTAVNEGEHRNDLILELSEQLSKQELEIMDLKGKLRERDEQIKKLSGTKRAGSGNRAGIAGRNKTKPDPLAHAQATPEQDEWSADNLSSLSVAHTSAIEGASTRADTRRTPGVQDGGNDRHDADHDNDDLREMHNLAREMAQLQANRTRAKTKQKKKKPPHADTLPMGESNKMTAGKKRTAAASPGVTPSGADGVHMKDGWTTSKQRSMQSKLWTPNFSEDDQLELRSVRGTTPSLPRTGRPASPDSDSSQWTDDPVENGDGDQEDADLTGTDQYSTVSVSSIRRISAPKKKKKHVLGAKSDPLFSMSIPVPTQ